MLISGFIGLKGILHNIILIIPVVLPLTGSPHVTLINVIQTLKITSLFVHYQGSMVEQQSLLPAWKNINCTHRLCQPPFSETQGRISCRSGEKVAENFRHTSVSSPNPTDSAQGCQPPILSITIKCAPSLTRSLSHAPSFHEVGVWWFPATRAVNMRKFCFFLRSSPFLT